MTVGYACSARRRCWSPRPTSRSPGSSSGCCGSAGRPTGTRGPAGSSASSGTSARSGRGPRIRSRRPATPNGSCRNSRRRRVARRRAGRGHPVRARPGHRPGRRDRAATAPGGAGPDDAADLRSPLRRLYAGFPRLRQRRGAGADRRGAGRPEDGVLGATTRPVGSTSGGTPTRSAARCSASTTRAPPGDVDCVVDPGDVDVVSARPRLRAARRRGPCYPPVLGHSNYFADPAFTAIVDASGAAGWAAARSDCGRTPAGPR